MSTACVLVAAGAGTRLAAGAPKAFVELGGRTLLEHAAERVLASGVVGVLVVVVPADRLAAGRALVGPDHCVVVGGSSRQESVRAGLAALGSGDDVVLVHDAARCLAPPVLVARVEAAVRSGHPVVVPGVPVHDTVRLLTGDGASSAVVDRAGLRAVQTPQGFSRSVLEAAHTTASRATAPRAAAYAAATDDAALAELAGHRVHLVPGAPEAFKVTRPLDLALALALLREPAHTGAAAPVTTPVSPP